MGKTAKLWKCGGAEDKFLQKLIDKGQVNNNTIPSALKQQYPHIFNGFSLPVIRNHLNDVKRRNGLFRE